MVLMKRIMLLAILLASVFPDGQVPVGTADAAETPARSTPIVPFRFDHRNYRPGIVVADTASCKKQCEKDRQKCYQRCEDLYGDSPQGGGCRSECDRAKKDDCRPRC